MTDRSKTLPSLERILYDAGFDADTRFGLGSDQIFVDPDLAQSTVIGILTDSTREFAGVDIDSFVNNNVNFSTPEDIVATMQAIYDSFQVEDVNYIFFQVLNDAFVNKEEFKEFFKTSWVALQITQNVAIPQSVEAEDTNVQGGGGCFTDQPVTPTVTPSLTAPPPSPTITPTTSVTPSGTPEVTPTTTVTPTVTPTITITATITPTISDTPVVTPTVTVTPTDTPAVSVTPTVTLTPSVTPTQEATATPTPTATSTQLPSPQPTNTPTPTPSLTPGPTAGPVTPTNTPTVTPTTTASSTLTPTPTVTATPSDTPGVSSTSAPTPTPTPTATATVTPTATVTATSAVTPTPTTTPTPSPQFISMFGLIVLTDLSGIPGTALASIEYRSDGATKSSEGGAPSVNVGDNWWYTNPIAGVGDDYEIYATIYSETPAGAGTTNLDGGSSALDTWLPLSSLQWWGYTISSGFISNVQLDISIRHVGGPTLDTSRVRFTLNREA